MYPCLPPVYIIINKSYVRYGHIISLPKFFFQLVMQYSELNFLNTSKTPFKQLLNAIWIFTESKFFKKLPTKYVKLAILYVKIPDTEHLPKSAEIAKAILPTINSAIKKSHTRWLLLMAGTTRLELATSCVTGMRSNQTELRSHSWLLYKYNLLKIFCKEGWI